MTAESKDKHDARFYYVVRTFTKTFRGRKRPRFNFTPGSDFEPASIAFRLGGETHTVVARPNEDEDELYAHAMWSAIKIDRGETPS